jgi:hypothetical protein
MGTSLEAEVEEELDLGSGVPCSGLTRALDLSSGDWDFEPCELPAQWQSTVTCCSVRSKFACQAHYEYKKRHGVACVYCDKGWITVTWRKL